jgi:dTDP-4-dehydrorhamnose reductase
LNKHRFDKTLKILLTGKNGQVGWELQRTLSVMGTVIACGRSELDLQNPDAIRTKIQELHPDVIVNAAAYTAVDKAEEEPEAARLINATAPGVLAEEAKKISAFMVHYSTDYVFDGTINCLYKEDDQTNPVNVYGKTKLEGEQAITASGANHVTLRTSWVYGTRGKNFLLTIKRLAKERDELRIVDDQIGTPTWCRMLAELTSQIIARYQLNPEYLREVDGIYHAVGGGETSWYGFAKAILEQLDNGESKPTKLTPIPTSEYPLPANRPYYSVMSNSKLKEVFGLEIPTWQKQLELALDIGL